MAVVNFNKTKLVQEIKSKFPRCQKPEDLADVLIIGKELYAFDKANGKPIWQFVKKGAKKTTSYSAHKRYGLLIKINSVRRIFLMYKGPESNPKGDAELTLILNKQRRGLYAHLTNSTSASRTIALFLKLNSSSISAIRNFMEQGTLQYQVGVYDKVFSKLEEKYLYNKQYGYFPLGFRYIPDKYWLTKLAQQLLTKAKI